jgi:O-antigen ligase
MMPSISVIRASLANVRLVLLYALLWMALLATAAALQGIRDRWLPAPDPLPPADSPAHPIPFLGVNVALEQYEDSASRRHALQQLQAAGFGWVRQRVDWNQLEPVQGQHAWQLFDEMLADIVAADLVPVVVLDGSPAWARSPRDAANPLAPPERFEDFARFAETFASRYHHRVRFYQIWDEPNIAPHWGEQLIDPVGYARLLKVTAAAVRSADPDAVILLAALAPTQDRGHTAIDEIYYLQRLYAAGAAPDFDVVAIQPFGFGLHPGDPRSRADLLNFARARLIRQVMVAAGDTQTPVWAVRFGWNRQVNSVWRTVTPEAQFRYTVEAVNATQEQWPWLAAMAWAIDRPAAPIEDPAWGFSLFDPAGEATMLAHAFTHPPLRQANAAPDPLRGSVDGWWLLLLGGLLGAAMVLWRAGTALRLLPLRHWIDDYRSWTLPWQMGAWGILLLVYYLATWPPLILLCWLAAAAFILAHPRHGLILCALLIPFHFFHKEIDLLLGTLPVPPAQAALLCTLPAVLIRLRSMWPFGIRLSPQEAYPIHVAHLNWYTHHALRTTSGETLLSTLPAPMDRLALGWLLLGVLSAWHVWHWPAYLAGVWSLVLVPLLFYLTMRVLATRPGDHHRVLAALGTGGALAAALGILAWLAGEGVDVDGVRRLVGLTFSPNQSALYLARTLFLALGLALAAQKFRALQERPHRGRGAALWGSVAFVAAAALILTGSRGALLLGFPAGLLTLLALGRSRPLNRRWMLIFLAAVGVVALAGFFLWGERMSNSETVLRRFAIWQGAFELWRSYPLLGVGPGGFSWHYPAFIRPFAVEEPNLLHAHNLWLNLLTGWGILGILWLALLLRWLYRQTQTLPAGSRGWLQIGLLAALAAALAHAQVDAFIVLPEIAAWNWVVFALLTQDDQQ